MTPFWVFYQQIHVLILESTPRDILSAELIVKLFLNFAFLPLMMLLIFHNCINFNFGI